MDKVIIDGVDVSECEHYRAEIETKMPYGEYETLKDKCHYSGIEIIQDCKGNKGCIYKQLKRLQAEYDDLHLSYAGCKTANTGLKELNKNLEEENKILNNMLKVNDSTKYDYYKFIKENEQLKKSIDRIMQDKEIKTIDLDIAKENAELKAENEHYRKEAYRLADGLNKTENLAFIYKQALQEIRELIKKLDLSLGCAYGDYDCDNCSDINEETVCKIKLQNIILAKINEVIGAE